MKNAAGGNRRLAAKGDGTPKTIDEYLSRVPEPARSTLRKVRAAVRAAAPPEAIEAISYRIPAFRYKGVLVWFAAFSDHCSFFPTASVLKMFREELKGYETSKGTIHFPIDEPLPIGLIRGMVKARVAQNDREKPRR